MHDRRADAPPHWWQRALPVSGLAALAVVGVLTSARGEEQVQLSTSRQPQQFVELQLARPSEQVCGARRAKVGFALRSHLAETRDLRWKVVVDRAGKQPPVQRQGTVKAQPTVVRVVQARLRAPRGEYDVKVTLPGRPETLRVHCGGTR